MPAMLDRPRVLVLGAGVIGAAVAYHLTGHDCEVLIAGREAAPAAPMASWASAGGLKFQRVEVPANELTKRATRRWPRLPDELEADIGLRLWGSLEVATTESEIPALDVQIQSDREQGMQVDRLTAADFSEVGAPLAPGVQVGAFVASGGQADPRRTTQALLDAAARRGAQLVGSEARGIVVKGDRVVGTTFLEGSVEADWVVLAAGHWSAQLAGSAGLDLPLRPAPAHMLLSGPIAPLLFPTVSAVGRVLSIKQLPNRKVLVGGGWPATVAEDGMTCSPQEMSVERNVSNARQVAPWCQELALPVAWCGVDGETPDHLPVIGPAPEVEGLYLATGFSLGGFQISPTVGELVADELIAGKPQKELERLRPTRFQGMASSDVDAFRRGRRGIPPR